MIYISIKNVKCSFSFFVDSVPGWHIRFSAPHTNIPKETGRLPSVTSHRGQTLLLIKP